MSLIIQVSFININNDLLVILYSRFTMLKFEASTCAVFVTVPKQRPLQLSLGCKFATGIDCVAEPHLADNVE